MGGLFPFRRVILSVARTQRLRLPRDDVMTWRIFTPLRGRCEGPAAFSPTSLLPRQVWPPSTSNFARFAGVAPPRPREIHSHLSSPLNGEGAEGEGEGKEGGRKPPKGGLPVARYHAARIALGLPSSSQGADLSRRGLIDSPEAFSLANSRPPSAVSTSLSTSSLSSRLSSVRGVEDALAAPLPRALVVIRPRTKGAFYFRQTTAKGPCGGVEEDLPLSFAQGTTEYRWGRLTEDEEAGWAPVVSGSEPPFGRICRTGMPKGFPDTTAAGFQSFFCLSQASSFISNFGASLGFQSLLNGFFLGSSPQLWILKDLGPALMAAYLANRVVNYENRPKFWFSISVFFSNTTVILEMMIPSLVPKQLLLAAIITSTVKQSASLMYSVSRAAALQHFATHNNLSELTRKFNSVGMVTYTIATALGIVFCTYIPSFTIQLTAVVVCCVLNMVLAPMIMGPIVFRIVNFNTIQLIMHAYITEGKIVTPDWVSENLGIIMEPRLPKKPYERPSLIYISPPINKLIIRSETLEEDVLYVDRNGMFMLALWEPTNAPLTIRECWHRWEMPSFFQILRYRLLPRWLQFRWGRRRTDAVFGGKRLVLLVHNKCPPRDLITAYLILYTAVLMHATTELELRSFIKSCHAEQKKWRDEASHLRENMRLVNWDVDLPALDHLNFRLSEMIAPLSMREGDSVS
ncbi:unnamed protein product [Phytomonas sp. EM1]|nr:unnamed protein product [Phytomonas sp. EM1]|eukprot:CCW62840.1 unnamed protein product [Phytomonas sp. isolate EM1]